MNSLTQLNDNRKIKRKTIIRGIKHDFGAWTLILPSLLLLYLFVWRPIILGSSLSFFEMKGYTPVKFVGLSNYIRVFNDTQFLKSLWNTLKYVIFSLLLGYFPPVILAIMLNEVVHFKSYFKFTIYFPSIVPGIVTALLWYLMYYPDASGLLNTILSYFGVGPQQWLQNPNCTILLIVISMTWNGMGSTVILYLASLQGVNQELYEAAIIDGAGILRRARSITLPQISNVMLLFLVMQITNVFQVMVQPLTMTGGGPYNASTSLALQAYRYAFVYFKVDSSLALGVITFIILMILTVFYFYLNKRVGNDN